MIKKIMVVDDEKDLLTAMKASLKKKGYTVVVTTSCEDALTILSTFKPDLIFLDINVGKEDGRVMCRKVKALAEHKHVPIILMSPDGFALQSYRVYRADSIMSKPFQPSDLLNEAARYLSPGFEGQSQVGRL
jgi:DNA-binding response OmpR family regulator